ncbi:hypothetical protein AVEN_93609-1 [Araneus ventricosus]|uniref:Uncharacterized protein n=1 Tax=Araneus ventricosus TaxID=182803 RepID=A0A4Y2T445_ARAVE|nr:hypothetical protein AVEN_93609-1 [Araneus ventricosus]
MVVTCIWMTPAFGAADIYSATKQLRNNYSAFQRGGINCINESSNCYRDALVKVSDGDVFSCKFPDESKGSRTFVRPQKDSLAFRCKC